MHVWQQRDNNVSLQMWTQRFNLRIPLIPWHIANFIRDQIEAGGRLNLNLSKLVANKKVLDKTISKLELSGC